MKIFQRYPPGMWSIKKLKRTDPGGSILLLKLTKLTNLTKPKLMKKNVIQIYAQYPLYTKYSMLNYCKIFIK